MAVQINEGKALVLVEAAGVEPCKPTYFRSLHRHIWTGCAVTFPGDPYINTWILDWDWYAQSPQVPRDLQHVRWSGAASHTPLDLTDQKGGAAPTTVAVSRFVVATLTW